MPIRRRQLEDLVAKGLVADIFKVERAHKLLQGIGENAEALNSRDNGNFGELFGTIQEALQTEALMAVARIYDRTDERYPTRCMKEVLSFLEEHHADLPPIREAHNLTNELRRLDFCAGDVDFIDRDESAFALSLVAHFRQILEDRGTVTAVEGLKRIRDKAIAHNERVHDLAGPTWAQVRRLTDTAKDLVSVLGWAYFSTAYTINGDYILTSDAARPSRALARLIERIQTGVAGAA